MLTNEAGELAKRTAKRAKAEAELKVATEADDKTDVDKFSKRLVRVTRDHNEDCKKLLSLMGVPVVTAPSEAEAQCAALAREGIVYGTATEDMDALTFQTPKLLRRMTFSGSNQPILEVDYQKLLQGLELTHEKFIDLCVLCGCDYTGSIKGIGPKKALNLVRQHGTIEEIIKHLDAKKYPLPDDWLEPSERAEKRKQARQEAKVQPACEYNLKWTDPDEPGLLKFLVEEKGFNADRVTSGIAKLKSARKNVSQKRMDSFFSVIPNPNAGAKKPTAKGKAGAKGKAAAAKGKGKVKKR